MDLVYIVRNGDNNVDLRYSLRSVDKFVKYDKIWIVGYKPRWVGNVEYIKVTQGPDKWKNSVNNIIAACESKDVSDDFVLMNDDFFAIKPVEDLEKSCNVALGSLDKKIEEYKRYRSGWYNGFRYAKELLKQMNIPEPYYDYESHSPIIINKQNFLDFINRKEIQDFMKSPVKVLHKRSIYKNMYKITPTILKEDVKINKDGEVDNKIDICEWLSVFDNQVNNRYYPKLNKLLRDLFPDVCKYELTPPDEPIIAAKPINLQKKKRDFIHRF